MEDFLNLGYEEFLDIYESPKFVDKSLIIEKLNQLMKDKKKRICVSRPRRFGKTSIMELLVAFYSKGCDSRHIFSNLKIAQTPDWDKNLNKYNVTVLDIQDILDQLDDDADLVETINKCVTNEIKLEFPNINFSGIKTVKKAIQKVHDETNEQFIIILDEYDVLVRENVEQEILDLYLDFLIDLFKSEDTNKAIALAYLTGILPTIIDDHSSLSNFLNYSVISPDILADSIGFTEDEVHELCIKHDMKFEEIKSWYNGYNLEGIDIYVADSICKAMSRKNLENFWTQTGSYKSISNLINVKYKGIIDDIKNLLSGQKVGVNTTSFLNTKESIYNKDDVFTYLIHIGYLTSTKKNGRKVCYIPNRDSYESWKNAIERIPELKESYKILNSSLKLVKYTREKNVEEILNGVAKAHTLIGTAKDFTEEITLQKTLYMAYYIGGVEKYRILQEATISSGYADLILIPRNESLNVIVIELKVNHSTNTAIDQIKKNKYGQDLGDNNLLLVGINYSTKTKEYTCEIEEYTMKKQIIIKNTYSFFKDF